MTDVQIISRTTWLGSQGTHHGDLVWPQAGCFEETLHYGGVVRYEVRIDGLDDVEVQDWAGGRFVCAVLRRRSGAQRP